VGAGILIVKEHQSSGCTQVPFEGRQRKMGVPTRFLRPVKDQADLQINET
jgi:hypothetical protein